MGVEGEKTVPISGTTYSGTTIRWYQCPLCKIYIDALNEEYEPPRLLAEHRIRCPLCGCAELDDVNPPANPFFSPTTMKILEAKGIVPKQKARFVPPMSYGFIDCVKEAQAVIQGCGLFAADEFNQGGKEPAWPRELAAVILGVGLYVGKGRSPGEETQNAGG